MNVISRPVGKRGMKTFRRDSIKLRFGDIFKATLDLQNLKAAPLSVLPMLPSGRWYGHLSNNEPFSWGMLANDQVGDCVIAGAMHESMVLTHAAGGALPSFTPQNALANYSAALVDQGGAPYNPRNPETDTGLDPQLAAEWRCTTGIIDTNGVVHKIDAYALIENWTQALYAIDLFGVVGLGWSLPNSAEEQFASGHVWDDTSGEPSDGHYTPAAQLNSEGHLVAVTWGDLQGATPQYFSKYCDCVIAYISREYLEANGKTPEAIDWATLEAYLGQIKKT